MKRSHLKWIALVTMTIDHIGYFLINQETTLYLITRSIGRLAFPIFAFLIAEGFFHTRNFWKYLTRILIVGVVLEAILFGVYFMYDDNYTLFTLGGTHGVQLNIMWTLANGLLGLYVLTKHDKKYQYLIAPIIFISLFFSYSFY